MLTISLFISTEGVAASRNAEAVINAFPLSVAGTFLSDSGGIIRGARLVQYGKQLALGGSYKFDVSRSR